jgi:hypothetical protein
MKKGAGKEKEAPNVVTKSILSRGKKRSAPHEWTQEEESTLLGHLQDGRIPHSKLARQMNLPDGVIKSKIVKMRKDGLLADLPSSEACTQPFPSYLRVH